MRRVALIVIVILLTAAGSLWFARITAPPLPGPPVSSLIASVAPAASAEARGLPTLAPMLRRTTPAIVSITVQAREAAENNPPL